MRFVATSSVVASALLAAAPVSAQIQVGAYVASATHSEISETFRARGWGTGPELEVRARRYHVQASAVRMRLARDDFSFALTQTDVHAGVWVLPNVAAEIGLSRRWIEHTFAGQDVAAISLGAFSETRLTRRATVRLRAGYVPKVAFRGGGRVGSAIAIGLGSALASRDGVWRAQLDASVQRFDREIPGEARPIQTSIARFGIVRRWKAI